MDALFTPLMCAFGFAAVLIGYAIYIMVKDWQSW